MKVLSCVFFFFLGGSLKKRQTRMAMAIEELEPQGFGPVHPRLRFKGLNVHMGVAQN